MLIVDNRNRSNYTKQHEAAASNYRSNSNTIKNTHSNREICVYAMASDESAPCAGFANKLLCLFKGSNGSEG